jgi:dienelactone hydrolase
MRLVLSVLSLASITLCACGSDSTTPSNDPGASTGGSGASSGSGGSGGVDGDAAPQDGPSVDEDAFADADSQPEEDATSPDAGPDGPEFPIGTEGYTITPTTTTLHDKGFVAHVDAGGDDVDVYVPLTPQPTPLPVAVYMQGGKVDKIHYRNFSRLVAAHGLVVAVANHDSLTGANMTEQSVFNEVWATLKASTQDVSSPLHGRIDPTKVAVMGHSLGGVAALAILANKCSPPLCLMGYDAPPELAAGVLYGTNTKTPVIGTFQNYDLRNLPTLFVQGAIDGKAVIADGVATFEDHVTGNPRGFVTVDGANHYGITDENNPPGADADPNSPTLDQSTSNETVARWSAMFLRAHLLGDAAADDYVYGDTGDAADANATIDLKP